MDHQGFKYPGGKKMYFFYKKGSPPRVPPPPHLILDGYRGSFPGLRRQWRDADHTQPSSAEVKNEWSYTSTLLCALAWTGTTLAILH